MVQLLTFTATAAGGLVPSGYEPETVWRILVNLLFALVMGGVGVGLLVRAVWQWWTYQRLSMPSKSDT